MLARGAERPCATGLALNLYSQGIDPRLDFSDINSIARVAEECTALPIHPRHPYVGDLVFTAFSGSHQDAIRKGLAAQDPGGLWEVPYLPIDPADLGRTYDTLIRVNSQSGKGGIAYLLERDHGVVMPRRMQVEFGAVVQGHADAAETEIASSELWSLFETTYLRAASGIGYVSHHLFEAAGSVQGIELKLIGIGGAVTRAPLPHHRTCGSASGGSAGGAAPERANEGGRESRRTHRVVQPSRL